MLFAGFDGNCAGVSRRIRQHAHVVTAGLELDRLAVDRAARDDLSVAEHLKGDAQRTAHGVTALGSAGLIDTDEVICVARAGPGEFYRAACGRCLRRRQGRFRLSGFLRSDCAE
ncbi:MAG: hypothetical protein H0W33_06035 [Gammaproteobacteria bacterium]|nr:hypothetical protein [Gammaproteobacteria bacterium]